MKTSDINRRCFIKSLLRFFVCSLIDVSFIYMRCHVFYRSFKNVNLWRQTPAFIPFGSYIFSQQGAA